MRGTMLIAAVVLLMLSWVSPVASQAPADGWVADAVTFPKESGGIDLQYAHLKPWADGAILQTGEDADPSLYSLRNGTAQRLALPEGYRVVGATGNGTDFFISASKPKGKQRLFRMQEWKVTPVNGVDGQPFEASDFGSLSGGSLPCYVQLKEEGLYTLHMYADGVVQALTTPDGKTIECSYYAVESRSPLRIRAVVTGKKEADAVSSGYEVEGVRARPIQLTPLPFPEGVPEAITRCTRYVFEKGTIVVGSHGGKRGSVRYYAWLEQDGKAQWLTDADGGRIDDEHQEVRVAENGVYVMYRVREGEADVHKLFLVRGPDPEKVSIPGDLQDSTLYFASTSSGAYLVASNSQATTLWQLDGPGLTPILGVDGKTATFHELDAVETCAGLTFIATSLPDANLFIVKDGVAVPVLDALGKPRKFESGVRTLGSQDQLFLHWREQTNHWNPRSLYAALGRDGTVSEIKTADGARFQPRNPSLLITGESAWCVDQDEKQPRIYWVHKRKA